MTATEPQIAKDVRLLNPYGGVRIAGDLNFMNQSKESTDKNPEIPSSEVMGRKLNSPIANFEATCLLLIARLRYFNGAQDLIAIQESLCEAVRLAREYEDFKFMAEGRGFFNRPLLENLPDYNPPKDDNKLTTYALAVVMSKTEPMPQGGFNTIERLLVGYRKCTSKDEAVGSFITKAFADNRGFNAGEVVAIVVP